MSTLTAPLAPAAPAAGPSFEDLADPTLSAACDSGMDFTHGACSGANDYGVDDVPAALAATWDERCSCSCHRRR